MLDERVIPHNEHWSSILQESIRLVFICCGV
jgi:hypothetical protein